MSSPSEAVRALREDRHDEMTRRHGPRVAALQRLDDRADELLTALAAEVEGLLERDRLFEQRVATILELARVRYPNVTTLESAWDAMAADRNEAEAKLAACEADARRYQHSRESALTEVAGRRGITVTDELRRKHHAAFDASVDAEISAAMPEKCDG